MYVSGDKIDKVTIIEFDSILKKYKCRCDCGKVIYKTKLYLEKNGAKIGCGCFRKSDGLNYVGKKYNRITIFSPSHYKNKRWYYNCVCDCGNKKILDIKSIKYGNTKSCGCYFTEKMAAFKTTHGKGSTKLYGVWKTIKSRCYNPNFPRYKNYGARGIKLCDEWKDDFQMFFNWAITNGYKQGLTIDRIDVNGNYEPTNCRFVTSKVQANNKTNNHYIYYNGEKKTISQWSKIMNINYGTLRNRIKLGWSIEKVLNTPVRKIKKE